MLLSVRFVARLGPGGVARLALLGCGRFGRGPVVLLLVRPQRARAVCAMAGITTAPTVTCSTTSPATAEVVVAAASGRANDTASAARAMEVQSSRACGVRRRAFPGACRLAGWERPATVPVWVEELAAHWGVTPGR
jgi:hypothetical protein